MLWIDENGNRFWFNKEGELHRKDGPAIEMSDGSKEWYVNGERHRIDGPSVEWRDGNEVYWLDGKYYNKKEYREKANEYVRDQ